MDNENKSVNNTYSALQQAEIRRISQKYKRIVSQSEESLEQLRIMDKRADRPGTVVSLIIGIIGSVILGIGVRCAIVRSEDLFIAGIVMGAVGIIGVLAAYPIYVAITKRQREKIATEIIRISDKLME